MKSFKKIGLYLFSLALLVSSWQCAALSGSGRPKLAKGYSSVNIEIDSTLADDPAVERIIAPYRKEMNKIMEKVIGIAGVEMNKGKPEAPLNNFIADLMLERANKEYGKKVSAAITNVSGLRRDIPKGPITVGVVYEVMPFENELVVLEMTGDQISQLAQQIGEKGGECIAGLKIEYRNKAVKSIRVQGQPVQPDKIYYVTTTDYLSTPGRKSLGVLGQAKRDFLGVLLRDTILDKIAELQAAGKQVTAKVEGRIVFH